MRPNTLENPLRKPPYRKPPLENPLLKTPLENTPAQKPHPQPQKGMHLPDDEISPLYNIS